MTEQQFQAAMIETAQRLGWAVARFPAANFVRTRGGREFVKPLEHDTKGYPDCTFVRERLVVIEFKAAKGALSHEQAVWLDRLLRAGIEAYIARPGDVGAVETLLRWNHQAGFFPQSMFELGKHTRDQVARVLGKDVAA